MERARVGSAHLKCKCENILGDAFLGESLINVAERLANRIYIGSTVHIDNINGTNLTGNIVMKGSNMGKFNANININPNFTANQEGVLVAR